MVEVGVAMRDINIHTYVRVMLCERGVDESIGGGGLLRRRWEEVCTPVCVYVHMSMCGTYCVGRAVLVCGFEHTAL